MERAGAIAAARPTVVVVGPLPPPYHGGAIATSFVLRSRLSEECRILHLDTTDRRGLLNIGHFDIGNILLALRHAGELMRMVMIERPAAVYVPVAQNRLGLLRDAALVLPAMLCGRRVVLHVHGSGLRDFHDAAGPGMRALVRLMFGRATRVIVLGESLRPMLAGITAGEKIAVVPNGTEDAFGERLPTRDGDDDGPVRVLYLGNLMRAKGFLELIDAISALRADGHQVTLDLAGGFTAEVDREAARLRIETLGDAVRLHGVVEGARKQELLSQADIFVLPSHSEGHPYVILEAMAAGLPIVATALPAVSETVVDGETGLIVPVKDAEALYTAILQLMTNVEMRLRFGRAARRRFEAGYSFDAWSQRLAAVMTDALR